MIPLWLTQLATGRAALLVLSLWLVVATILFQMDLYQSLVDMTPGLPLLDERWGYSDVDVIAYLAMLGESGRHQYRTFLLADFGNAILMAAALTLLLAFLMQRLGQTQSLIAVLTYLPAIAMVLDWCENIVLLRALGRFPEIDASLSTAGAMFTIGKLTTSLAGIAAVILMLGVWGLAALRRRRPAG